MPSHFGENQYDTVHIPILNVKCFRQLLIVMKYQLQFDGSNGRILLVLAIKAFVSPMAESNIISVDLPVMQITSSFKKFNSNILDHSRKVCESNVWSNNFSLLLIGRLALSYFCQSVEPGLG